MTEEISGTCRYFVTYSGVKLPLRLLNELEPAQLENRNTYFCGHFDEQGRLIHLQKMVYGEIELEHRYFYNDKGSITRAEIIDAEGELTAMSFD